MALTAKEKMKRYREKLKSNQEKFEKVKEKDRERKKMAKLKMSKRKLAKEREKNRKRVQEHRLRIKKSSEHNTVNENPVKMPMTNLMTPQTLGKAKQRVTKHLPRSPRKKMIVLQELASDIGLISKQKEVKKTNTLALRSEIKNKVEMFFLETSWVCPGKKDYVTIEKNKKKIKMQKQFMLSTLKEAHGMFLQQNKDVKISFSKFATLRPKQVLLQQDVPHTTCLCIYHENVRLLLVALEKILPPIPISFREFCSVITCNQDNEMCMFSECNNCPQLSYFKAFDDFEEVKDLEIEWYQWKTHNTKVVKTVENGTVEKCFAALEGKVPNFLRHTYIKRKQAESFQFQKLSVHQNCSKVIIQVDFAENYTTMNQNEIQLSYWSYNQITLFTVCAWEAENKHSMVIVSDYMSHDKYAVITFLKLIILELETKHKHFDEIVFFSDGASSQFKQKYLLCALIHLKRNITWEYFATSHGKGAVDGIGGVVKRTVSTAVLSKQEQVQNAPDFFRVAKSKCEKISVLYCGTKEIESNMEEYNKIWENIVPIPNLRNLHFAKVISKYMLELKIMSVSSDSSYHNFNPKSFCEPTKELKLSICSGQWVLVKYVPASSSKKMSIEHHYVGQVLSVHPSRLYIKFLKCSGKTFIWPTQDDFDYVEEKNVVMTLSEPQMDRRGHLAFGNDNFVKKYNVK